MQTITKFILNFYCTKKPHCVALNGAKGIRTLWAICVL